MDSLREWFLAVVQLAAGWYEAAPALTIGVALVALLGPVWAGAKRRAP